jgi:hypothetical protein
MEIPRVSRRIDHPVHRPQPAVNAATMPTPTAHPPMGGSPAGSFTMPGRPLPPLSTIKPPTISKVLTTSHQALSIESSKRAIATPRGKGEGRRVRRSDVTVSPIASVCVLRRGTGWQSWTCKEFTGDRKDSSTPAQGRVGSMVSRIRRELSSAREEAPLTRGDARARDPQSDPSQRSSRRGSRRCRPRRGDHAARRQRPPLH